MGKRPNNKGKNPSNVLAGRNLRYFIETIGMSRDELAEKLGIWEKTVFGGFPGLRRMKNWM